MIYEKVAIFNFRKTDELKMADFKMADFFFKMAVFQLKMFKYLPFIVSFSRTSMAKRYFTKSELSVMELAALEPKYLAFTLAYRHFCRGFSL